MPRYAMKKLIKSQIYNFKGNVIYLDWHLMQRKKSGHLQQQNCLPRIKPLQSPHLNLKQRNMSHIIRACKLEHGIYMTRLVGRAARQTGTKNQVVGRCFSKPFYSHLRKRFSEFPYKIFVKISHCLSANHNQNFSLSF